MMGKSTLSARLARARPFSSSCPGAKRVPMDYFHKTAAQPESPTLFFPQLPFIVTEPFKGCGRCSERRHRCSWIGIWLRGLRCAHTSAPATAGQCWLRQNRLAIETTDTSTRCRPPHRLSSALSLPTMFRPQLASEAFQAAAPACSIAPEVVVAGVCWG